ncbi:vomeronasal type-1 receptor 4-like [Hippopotamus amphibius kiboko]|uniref:vomeronasal type-1 receptor 4-like n=1 Tax=Hippopotamus amphibius kiboko TaxID=575201 RepID=UPI002591C719|nr:vomeronasal type-1 receptor 4-like [Hippopotamus amphibius kiboko]
MSKEKTASRDLVLGIIFLSQTMIGILGNFSVLYHCLFLYHTQCRIRATHVILKHLTIANSLVILSKGVPQTITAFGLKHFFGDLACKLLLYVQRVGRGVSLGSTCLLIIFQTIMISPMGSCWKGLKVKAPKYVGFSISLCWVQCMFLSSVFPAYVLYVSVKWGGRNITKRRDLGYCVTTDHEKITGSVYAALIVFPEVSFSVLIIWASGSMVFTLYRHRQQVRYIHRARVSPRSSAETRATRSILVLVSTFICFHTLSSTFHVAIALLHNQNWLLVNTAALISLCFSTVSPFLLMNHDPTVSRLCFLFMRNSVSPNRIRKM